MTRQIAQTCQYVADVWRARYFWFSLVKMDLRTRYRGSVLGLGWSLLQPIAMTIILCTVFHAIFHVPVERFAPFLLAGLTLWNFVVQSTLLGCQSFFQGESYIRQQPVPLAIYPLRTALGTAVHFLMALIVVLLLSWYCKGFLAPLAVMSLLPTIAMLLLLSWSLAAIAGLANVYFQDTHHLSEIGFQVFVYLTPIMYEPSFLQQNHLGWALRLNPLVPFLELIRTPLLDGCVPHVSTFALAAVITLAIAGIASLSLARFGRYVIFLL